MQTDENLLETEVNAAAADLTAAMRELSGAQVGGAMLAQSLRDARDAAILRHKDDPKGLGANEAAREASLRAMTRDEQTRVDANDVALLEARLRCDRARLEWDRVRLLVRLLDIHHGPGDRP